MTWRLVAFLGALASTAVLAGCTDEPNRNEGCCWFQCENGRTDGFGHWFGGEDDCVSTARTACRDATPDTPGLVRHEWIPGYSPEDGSTLTDSCEDAIPEWVTEAWNSMGCCVWACDSGCIRRVTILSGDHDTCESLAESTCTDADPSNPGVEDSLWWGGTAREFRIYGAEEACELMSDGDEDFREWVAEVEDGDRTWCAE